uniref:Uncharacterized protein n=1 Tax=Timema shepardi TaxID=629360 RepID=A0A7R9G4Q2_TIMSH|nr:unnamed protein product [Timema shepardi]
MSGDCSGTLTPFLSIALRAPRTHAFLRIYNGWSPGCEHALHSGLSRFDGEDSAKQALSRLHQLDVLGFPLVVQFARGRSGQDFNLEKKHT